MIFLTSAQDEFRAAVLAEIADNIQAWLDANGMDAEVKAKLREELRKFRRGKDNTASRNTLLCLVEMSAIATRAFEEEIEETASNLNQGLSVTQNEIETMLRAHLVELYEKLAEIEEWLNDSKTAQSGRDLEDLAEDLRSLKGLIVLNFRSEPLALGQVLETIRFTPDIQWDVALIRRTESALAQMSQLGAAIEEAKAQLPVAAPRPITDIYEPIPMETLKHLRQDVLNLGDLPQIARKKGGPARKPGGPQTFDLETVTKMYQSLILMRIEGDAGHQYYFPEKLSLIDTRVKAYLGQCGWDSNRIKGEFEMLKTQALENLGVKGIPVTSLDQIISKDFERSDLISRPHPLTEKPFDWTKLAMRIWREAREIAKDFIRVVVMANGRKVYFVDKNKLEASGYLNRYPDFETLEAILGNAQSFEKLILILGGDEIPNDFVLAGCKAGDGIHGLKIISVEEAKGLSQSFFQIHFGEGGNRVIGVEGPGGMELGLAWLRGPGMGVEDPVEQALIASVWGGHLKAKKEEKNLLFSQLESTLSQRDGVHNLLDIYLKVKRIQEIPNDFVLAGRKAGDGIHGLKIISVEEAKGLSRSFFQIHFLVLFRGGVLTIIHSAGTGAEDLRRAWESVQISDYWSLQK